MAFRGLPQTNVRAAQRSPDSDDDSPVFKKPKLPVKPFRLLDLPILIREKAMRLIAPIDLFDLSLCSRRMTKYVKSLRLEAEQHKIIMTKHQIMISVNFPGREVIWWDFKPFHARRIANQIRRIGNVVFTQSERVSDGTLNTGEFYCQYADYEKGVAAVSEQFQKIFPGPKSIIINPFSFPELETLFSHEHMQSLNNLDICGFEQPSIKMMEEIFGKVTLKERLSIKPVTEGDYVIQQAFQVQSFLELRCAYWMSREHLLQINCRVVEIYDNKFISEDIEAFAAKWKEDTSKQWEKFLFRWDSGRPFCFYNLDAEAWDETKRESHFIYKTNQETRRIDCSDGFDMEREDGLLATFVLEQRDEHQFLHFLVFKERFPEKKRIAELPSKLAPFYTQLEKINREYHDNVALERLLCNRNLNHEEFSETYQVWKNMFLEQGRVNTQGQLLRQEVFEKMRAIIEA
ncbi:hypothetical protein L5515_004919 [Caenorhabditis briggsae]|uniref:F-box domain-containing protein n=1 Tax=Caenorhabditis briggsae TaxID=6238 RepID=A0AAE9JBQ6_CAEBR|nr:hypothetical protein L5515_004919 [Caenorhabditis briggsae]